MISHPGWPGIHMSRNVQLETLWPAAPRTFTRVAPPPRPTAAADPRLPTVSRPSLALPSGRVYLFPSPTVCFATEPSAATKGYSSPNRTNRRGPRPSAAMTSPFLAIKRRSRCWRCNTVLAPPEHTGRPERLLQLAHTHVSDIRIPVPKIPGRKILDSPHSIRGVHRGSDLERLARELYSSSSRPGSYPQKAKLSQDGLEDRLAAP